MTIYRSKSDKKKERPEGLARQFRELKKLRLEVAKAEAANSRDTRRTSAGEGKLTEKRKNVPPSEV